MKKLTCFILVVAFICVGFTSCKKHTVTGENSYITEGFSSQTVRGIENFDECHDSIDLTCSLFPEGFLENYNYIDGDFYYHSRFTIFSKEKSIDKTLMYLVYDDETYLEAKEYLLSLDSFYAFDFENPYYLNDYIFYDDLDRLNSCIEEGRDYSVNMVKFPGQYNMVGFNDSKNTIVAFSAYTLVLIHSFPEHVQEYYWEWYEFS